MDRRVEGRLARGWVDFFWDDEEQRIGLARCCAGLFRRHTHHYANWQSNAVFCRWVSFPAIFFSFFLDVFHSITLFSFDEPFSVSKFHFCSTPTKKKGERKRKRRYGPILTSPFHLRLELFFPKQPRTQTRERRFCFRSA